MFVNEDIYTGKTEPTATINPKIIGAFYINTSNATIYICVDNTLNKNKWVRSGYTLDEIWGFINPKLPKQQDMAFGDTYILDSTTYKHNIMYKNTTGYPMLFHVYTRSENDTFASVVMIEIWEQDGSPKSAIYVTGIPASNTVWIIAPNQSFRLFWTHTIRDANTICLRRR